MWLVRREREEGCGGIGFERVLGIVLNRLCDEDVVREKLNREDWSCSTRKSTALFR